MRIISLCLFMAALMTTATAKADSYDASQSMDGLTTRIVSSHGTSKVKGWMLTELARQTAANKAASKAASKAANKAATKAAIKTAAAHANTRKKQAVEIVTIASADQAVQPVTRNGYQPRVYHSQYYMPYMGHVSKPEPETDYREDYSADDYR